MEPLGDRKYLTTISFKVMMRHSLFYKLAHLQLEPLGNRKGSFTKEQRLETRKCAYSCHDESSRFSKLGLETTRGR
jgi:hypothetical protein